MKHITSETKLLSRASKSNGIKINILLFLGSCFISLGLAEGALRYFTLFPIHGHNNLQFHRLLGYTLSPKLADVDRDGFRNPSGVRTEIIVIGDSHTQGYNVTYEDSWPAKFSSKIKKPVYNFGVGGYGVLHYGVILATLPVDTNEIILGLYIANDFDYSNTPLNECITELGRQAIEREFKLTVPRCEEEVVYNELWTIVRERSALYSAFSYMSDRLLSKFPFRQKEAKAKTNVEPVNEIDGIPVRLRRHQSFTDRTNPKVAERVDYFVALMERFKQLHPAIILKVLMIPSKELVLHSAELKCPRNPPSGVVLNEIELRNYVMSALMAAGFQIEDGLPFILEKYCGSSREARDGMYPAFDQHPFAEGYEAYAQAAYVLYNHH